MRRPFPLVLAVLAASCLFAAGLSLAGLALASSGSSKSKLSAKLVPRSEVPRPKGASAASGLFTGVMVGTSLSWRLTFSRLTGKATAAHIHLGRAGVSGPVAVPLCGPCVSGAHGKTKLTARVRSAMLAGRAYVNVHTAKNPGGEIRGQVAAGSGPTPAPAPTTTAATTTSPGYDPPGYGG